MLCRLLPLLVCFVFTPLTSAEEPDRSPSPSSQSLTVQLRDGRVLTGYVDARTDSDVLWVRIEQGRIALSSGFTWDVVELVQIGDKKFSAPAFREMAHQYASELSATFDQLGPRGSLQVLPSRRSLSKDSANPAAARVQWLEVEAFAANWDHDADSDGIEIHVQPRTAEGQIVPVDGSLAVDLLVGHYGGQEAPSPRVVARWSQTLRKADFQVSGAVYRLTYPQPLDHDPSLASIGMIQARLNAFGSGEFEARAPARVRSYNPIQDRIDVQRTRYDAFGRYRARHW